jgi:predicted aspartyl protease
LVFKSAPKSEEAFEAHVWLIYLYQRAGRFRQVVAQIDEILKVKPDRADLKNARALFAAFGQYPEQAVAARRFSRVRYSVEDGNLFIPVSVNSRSSTYIVDTGAAFSTLSESEATRLGLAVHDASGHQAGDSAGLKFGVRIAIADQLKVGNVRLRHVPFLVARDDQQPFINLPAGKQGVLGLPVLLALQTMRWGKDGNFEIGFASVSRGDRKSNMCFEGVQPVIEAEFRQNKINVFLDTGATVTRVLPLFAKEFARFVKESGKEEPARVTGSSGSVEVEAITLPELTLRVGGFDAVLRPAQVLLKETTSDSRWWHAWMGLDMVNQARRVTLDFKSMRVTLE